MFRWTRIPVVVATSRLIGQSLGGIDPRVDAVVILAGPQRHHDLLERRVAGPFAEAVDRALDLPRARSTPARLFATANPRSLWQCVLMTAWLMLGTFCFR
ncbi:MAG: hypothetical protein QM777_08620 [Pseudorhodoferax sp.]